MLYDFSSRTCGYTRHGNPMAIVVVDALGKVYRFVGKCCVGSAFQEVPDVSGRLLVGDLSFLVQRLEIQSLGFDTEPGGDRRAHE